MPPKSIYAQDGVDTQEGDGFSSHAGKICKESFRNSNFVEVMDFSEGHFRGARAFRLKNLPKDYLMEAAPDGIGTKVVAIDAAFTHQYAANDVVAMTASDITRWGGKPLVFINVLDVSTLGKTGDATNEAFRFMMHGLGETAAEQNFVCFRGETAELGAYVGSERLDPTASFNWAGMMLGVYLPDRMITGNTLAPGQIVVALQENGFRSNGLSSVRAALRMKFGNEWWNNSKAQDHIKQAAEPSRLYDKFLTKANGWMESGIVDPQFNFHLITHVSGGGIVDKLWKDILLPRDLSVELNSLFDPAEIMQNIVDWRGMTARDTYETFNGGQGMLVVLDESEVNKFIDMAKVYQIKAKVCGTITKLKGKSQLGIHSKFGKPQWLTWEV